MISTWPCPNADGSSADEMLLSFDKGRVQRVLILPAWFDEANKMRRQTVQVMRQLDERGVDSFLPDLPGCNESLAPLAEQTLDTWRAAAIAAAAHVEASHVLAVRAGALIAPEGLPAWYYAPLTGAKVLRAMLRARVVAEREAGREVTSESLLEQGRAEGLTLAGWPIGAAMLCALEAATPTPNAQKIEQKALTGPGLWLRAEAGEDGTQAEELAAIVAGEEAAS